jgi:hypothetical protein
MAKNVEDFFNVINENLWRDNISSEAERKFDKLIQDLQTYKEDIISDVVDDYKRIEQVKVEEREEFEYSTFKKWLNKYVIETMQSYLEED